jgi:DNA-binding response OmpR family regulator
MGVSASRDTLSILIVEDDLLLGVSIAAVLEDLKFRVVGIATTRVEACSVAQLCRPNLALVDRRLTERPCWRGLPRILNEIGIPTIIIGEVACETNEISNAQSAVSPHTSAGAPFRPSEVFNELMVIMEAST